MCIEQFKNMYKTEEDEAAYKLIFSKHAEKGEVIYSVGDIVLRNVMGLSYGLAIKKGLNTIMNSNIKIYEAYKYTGNGFGFDKIDIHNGFHFFKDSRSVEIFDDYYNWVNCNTVNLYKIIIPKGETIIEGITNIRTVPCNIGIANSFIFDPDNIIL